MTGAKAMIHVVDDDLDHLAALVDLVEAAGHAAIGLSSGKEALAAAGQAAPDAVLTDLRMPGMDGMALMAALRAEGHAMPVVMLTGHGDVQHAVRAMRAGAEDFLEKPYDAAHLLAVLARALASGAARNELARLQDLVQARESHEILGGSAAMDALRKRIAALAPLDVDVVITGETGTGKELVARALHAQGGRVGGPYVGVNCAALPEALFEIEMFGHAAGAFPGAVKDKTGKLEAANGGTLVLDEIEAMPIALQSKLLRALQERQIERLGENRLRPLDLRIVATSKTDLAALVRAGGFRSDLYWRLAGADIATEPLRAMGQDIVLIFAHYARLAARRYGRDLPELGFSERRALLSHAWPGNVRELKAAAEAFALGIGRPIPSGGEAMPAAPGTLAERVASFEAREIRAALERFKGNSELAARALGLPRRTLNDKAKRFGLRG
ncbi:sigma-54-dependent transcriptional regulator [Albidovulum sediminicola]|uniref:Sigma-54 dependent transcriptional regulator n=1 Tax=Albidovulum sediminicola TaxID=2984331 RepID=A0ABT2Z359_9RHOB|nr:sigma-54 dependent transcriptional regulator [Defluviimonas sp. WL0075]MCV2865547.1 sigma-54 dependent transcriptional regulator [Defluviimonas sp. WL0075]